MTDTGYTSWTTDRSLAEAAKEQAISLPPFTGHGMGTARTLSVAGGRFVTFKHRLVQNEQAEVDGIEWTLWREQDGLPLPVAAFREPLSPNGKNVSVALALIKGWLVDGWSPDTTRQAVEAHPRKQMVEDVSVSDRTS